MAKLGGALIGYGIKKRNGEEKKVIFERPIHNTITKHCLNNLLKFNGTNGICSSNLKGNYCSLFVSSNETHDRYGVFNSCCLGNGTGETSVNDTDLKNRISTQTTTKKTGSGWCGTSYDTANALIKLRVSHIHSITQDFTIKEIGWYNAILDGGTLNYTLSSRVQLDTPVNVENGDEFYSIYEITISFQGVERFDGFAGAYSGIKTNSIIENYLSSGYPFPTIDTNGYAVCPAYYTGYPGTSGDAYGYAFLLPPWIMSSFSFGYNSRLFNIGYLGFNIDKLKPFTHDTHQGGPMYRNGSLLSGLTVYDYVEDSFRRDFEFIIGEGFVNNAYGIFVNGTLYRFGTFDENDNFTPSPVTINKALKIKTRQSWSTDLLTPTP